MMHPNPDPDFVCAAATVQSRRDTARMEPGRACAACGWPVVFACCNWDAPPGSRYDADWWTYCSNKTCIHHDGESMGQEAVEWVVDAYLVAPWNRGRVGIASSGEDARLFEAAAKGA